MSAALMYCIVQLPRGLSVWICVPIQRAVLIEYKVVLRVELASVEVNLANGDNSKRIKRTRRNVSEYNPKSKTHLDHSVSSVIYATSLILIRPPDLRISTRCLRNSNMATEFDDV
jgi:hypothetical protein